jgi:xylulokinase
VGAGIWPDVERACRATIQVTGNTQPNPAAVEQYEAVYAQYRALYPTLKTTLADLATL